MCRRGLYFRTALTWTLLAAAWVVSGCGEVPTGPSSSEDSAYTDAVADPSGTRLDSTRPSREIQREVNVSSVEVERQFDVTTSQPDVGGSIQEPVAEMFDPGIEEKDPRSRYALARTRL